jgi:tetratricopeptide (TPR) repeat protein
MSPLAYAASSRQALNGLAKRLIQLAEHFFGLRDIDSLREMSLVLQTLPIAEAPIIGQYYHALAIRRNGNIDESLPLLEDVADSAPMTYRARALQTLGAIYHTQGRIDEALRFYPEARRAASPETGCDMLTTLLVDQEIACIKSEMGDHLGALADYQKISPLVQIVSRQNPLYYYFYHNELAVEFAELGRLDEAKAACEIAINSPFAPAYPEWSETRDEIVAKRQSANSSVVAFNRIPEADQQEQTEPERQFVPVCVTTSHRGGFKKDFVQRAVIQIAASRAIVFPGIIESILKWMCKRIGSRAPPTLS